MLEIKLYEIVLTYYEDAYGWLGVILGILAYWILSHKCTLRMYVTAQIMNLVAAEVFIISALKYHFVQSMTFNVIWAAVAVWSLIRYRKMV